MMNDDPAKLIRVCERKFEPKPRYCIQFSSTYGSVLDPVFSQKKGPQTKGDFLIE